MHAGTMGCRPSEGVLVVVAALIVFLAPLVAIVGLLIWSRKNRANTFPACGKCGYDVSGSVGSVTRCPECGSAFTEVGIVPPRRRPMRAVFWVTAAVIVLLAGFIGITMTTAMYQRAVAERQRAVAQRAAAQAAAAAAIQSAPVADPDSDRDPDPVAAPSAPE